MPGTITAAITAAANTIAENLSDNNLELLSASLTQLADTLNTILVVREVCCDNDEKSEKENENSSNKSENVQNNVQNTTPQNSDSAKTQ